MNTFVQPDPRPIARFSRIQTRLFAAAAIAVIAGETLLIVLARRGPTLLALPWIELAVQSYAAFVTIPIAFFCFGRHRAVDEPASLWAGLGFLAYGILAASYVLVYPGVTDGKAVLQVPPNTFGWPFHFKWTALGSLLLAGTIAPGPRYREGTRIDLVLIGVTAAAALALAAATIAFGKHLPPLVMRGEFSPLNIYWTWGLTALFSASAVLAARKQARRPGGLCGYIAALSAIMAARLGSDIFGGQLYDLVWYLNRALLVGAFTLMLGMLLADHVHVLRDQRGLVRLARDRELKIRATFESLGEAVFVLDADGGIVDLNPAARTLLSQVRQEKGLPFLESADGRPLPPNEHPATLARAGRAVRSRLLRAQATDGRGLTLEASASPITSPAAVPNGAVLVLRDVTEVEWARSTATVARVATAVAGARAMPDVVNAVLVDSAAALQASVVSLFLVPPGRRTLQLAGERNMPPDVAERLRVMSFDAPTLTARAATSGRIEIIEDPGGTDTALSRELMARKGVGCLVAVPLVQQNRTVGVMTYALKESHPFSKTELDALRAIGDVIAVGVQNARLYDEAQEERLRLKAVFDASPEGLVVFEGTQGRISLTNEVARKLIDRPVELDRPRSELPEQLGLFRPDGTPFPLDDLPSSRALRGETVSWEELVIHSPKRQMPILVNAAPIRDGGGAVIGAVLLFQDITHVKDLERQREAFLHTISHDLRAPLAVILSNTQLAQRGALASDRLAKALGGIATSAARMNTMIQDLVDSARIESRQLTLKRVRLDLAAFVRELMERLAGTMETQRVRVTTPEGLPAVLADPDRIERVLINLISNAFKYSPPETPVDITLAREGQEVAITVSDRGSGIPPEEQARVFTPYYRTGQAHERQEGLGLGLFIAKGLVEAHGGRIWVTSTPGEGSTLGFTLPVAER
ncbi:MAG: PAS domain-containing protein [Planctomycetes bacterium]|nr:PAS domain-containing protein [Planctomycetota bacterium]